MNKNKLYRIFNFLYEKNILILLLIFFSSIFIFCHINLRPFWLDEAAVAVVIENPIGKLFSKAIYDGHHLTYIYSIKIWSLIFKDSELSFRIFSSIWALLLIPLMYKTALYFYKSRKVAVIAAFLTTTNYFLNWFAVQTRQYTLSAFLGLLSCYYFIKILKEGKKLDYIFYTIISILSIYSHTWLILIFLSQILTHIIIYKFSKKLKLIYLSQITISLFLIPYIFILLYQSKIGINSWIPHSNILVILESFKYLSYGLVLPYILASLIGYAYLSSQKTTTKQDKYNNKLINTFLFLYFLFPLISAFLVSLYKPAYVPGRFELIVLPPFLLLLSKLWSKINIKYLLSIFIFILYCLYTNVINEINLTKSFKSTYKIECTKLIDNIENGDIIITTDLNYAAFYYYLKKTNKSYNKTYTLISYPEEISEHPGWKNLDEMLKNKNIYEKEAEELITNIYSTHAKNIWLIYNKNNPINEIIFNKLSDNFQKSLSIIPEEPKEPSWFNEIHKFNKQENSKVVN